MSNKPPALRAKSGDAKRLVVKSLQERVDSAPKPDNANAEAVSGWGKATAKVLIGLVPGGAEITEFLTTADTITERIRMLKIETLLGDYLNKADDQDARLNELRDFVLDPWGNALFEKLRGILNDQPPDPEWTNLLANALDEMVGTNARDLFEDHKFALGIIEQLSPQQLVILATHRTWVQVPYSNGSWKDDMLSDDWSAAFSTTNAAPLGITGTKAQERLSHVVSSLIRQGFVIARGADMTIRIAGPGTETFPAAFKACPTDIAHIVLRYVAGPPDDTPAN
ncbi:MAG: hypothetical protein IE938_20210 [Pseudomonas balearica]|nr:hypothetical protein [Stutzerimonas balearica]